MPTYDLNGKVVLVTGAARGIGFATAQALQARGASVTVVDLDPDATVQAASQLGGSVLGVGGDVSDHAAMDAAVQATVERFGGLDVCVANAGTVARAATVRVMSPEVFERVISVNLLGVYNTVHAALPQIVARQGQAILVSSIYAFSLGLLVAPYAASKAGVEQLGRALRVELASHGASATVVYYGFIATEMTKQGFETDPLAARLESEVIPRLLRKHLTPEQAAQALVEGIEQRSARVIVPRRWAALSTLRGILNPAIDEGARKHRKLRSLISDADVPGRTAGQELIRAAGSEGK
jgi:NAD(P)-dependent dehydrogenase (short-subunit alcohol dehydrogenase family)